MGMAQNMIRNRLGFVNVLQDVEQQGLLLVIGKRGRSDLLMETAQVIPGSGRVEFDRLRWMVRSMARVIRAGTTTHLRQSADAQVADRKTVFHPADFDLK